MWYDDSQENCELSTVNQAVATTSKPSRNYATLPPSGQSSGFDDQLCELHGVEGCPLTQVVAHHPDVDAAGPADSVPHPSDEHIVDPCGVQRRRDAIGPHLDAGSVREDLDHLIRGQVAIEPHRRCDSVAGHDRHPNTGRLDRDRLGLEDLAGLVDELPLLVGVALLLLGSGEWDDVERDRGHVDVRARILPSALTPGVG